MIQNFAEGGLKMIDITSFNKALIKICLDKKVYWKEYDNGKWKLFFSLSVYQQRLILLLSFFYLLKLN